MNYFKLNTSLKFQSHLGNNLNECLWRWPMLKCNFFQGWCQRVLTSVTKVTRAGGGGGGLRNENSNT